MELSKRLEMDMKPVLKNPALAEDRKTLYFVERNVKVAGKLSYDLTLIPRIKIGNEFAKTFGHYHKNLLPELYEVLAGQALFLIQKYKDSPDDITESYVMGAEEGEKIIVPPGFGHVSINVGEEDLKLANWVGPVEYDYDSFKNLRGACYYVLDTGDSIEFEKNPAYKNVPELKKLKLRDIPDFGIINKSANQISDLTAEKLDWLINPEKYKEFLTIEYLYREL